jgi:hypothetical protein
MPESVQSDTSGEFEFTPMVNAASQEWCIEVSKEGYQAVVAGPFEPSGKTFVVYLARE